jgi:hypothetical protein
MNAAVTPNIYGTLTRFMKLSPADFSAEKKHEIESFFAHCMEDMDNDSQKLLATLLIKALNKRINSESIGENIYLGKYETSQIQLFNILIEKFPFVKYSQQITNSAIVRAMEGHEEATIVDIGIGQGTQMVNIIEMAKELPGLKKLHFVGIEPFGEALARAEETILSYNGRVPFNVGFTGIHDAAENVDFANAGYLPGIVIVNASLALHHIQSAEQRDATIARIRQLNPDAFILIEPNVNHYEPEFHTRFDNCYNHFHALFQVIDRLENVSANDKNALKLFFGREIEDIIGKEEKDRYEKHELASHWIGRLVKNRFTIKTDFLPDPIDPGCGVEIKFHPEGFLGFTFEEETALAVIMAN